MVRVRTDQSLPPLKMPWKQGIAMGRAYELLRADAQNHLKRVQEEIGYRYCRFHGLFHDDVSVAVRAEDGRLVLQWGHVDRVFDFLLGIGLRPFVELGPMPAALASGSQTFFHWRMNVTPPRDWGDWRMLVSTFARHCIERYGLEEVLQWYFEIWNEPNLSAFWSGTREEYWRLYSETAEALKSVDRGLRVGGPASAEAGWIDEFLAFCAESGCPVDFVSTHAYPQNEFAVSESRAESPYAPGTYLIDTFRKVKEKVRSWSRKDLEIHWTEWSTLDAAGKAGVDWYANDTIDSIYSAALICHLCVSLDSDADGMFWWVASDIFEEMGMPQSPFSGAFGLVTVDNVAKASFNAFSFVKKMTGTRLALEIEPLEMGRGAAAALDGDTLRLLAWNHVPLGLPETTWSDRFEVSAGSQGGIATAVTIERGQGSAYESWIAMGRPQNPTPVQMNLLRAHSVPRFGTHLLPPGMSSISFDLKPGEVLFVEIAGPPDPFIQKGNDASVTDYWNQALSDIEHP